MTGDGRFVVAIVRGDYDVEETKLGNAVKAIGGLRPAHRRGDQGARHGGRLRLADRGPRRAWSSSTSSSSARRTSSPARTGSGWHVRNVNVPRDYTPDVVAEIVSAREGDPCPRCGSPLKLRNGIEVGNIFKLGTDFAESLGAYYLGEDGEEHPVVMGSYGIGLGRNVACIVEAHHDEKGIVWPAEVAPYPAHLVSIGADQGAPGRRDRPRASTTPPRRPVASSCGTTGTSRPGSSSPTPSCSACPGS